MCRIKISFYPILIITCILCCKLFAGTLSKDENLLRGDGMMFVENKGQIIDMEKHLRPDILYAGESKSAKIYLRKGGISYVLNNMGEVVKGINNQLEELKHTGKLKPEEEEKLKRKKTEEAQIKIQRVDITFKGSNATTSTLPDHAVEGYLNYYYPHCPNGITNVTTYNKVVYENVYNNIDIAYYGSPEKELEYDVIVKPGGHPADIQLYYTGAEKLKIVAGKLIIETAFGAMTEMIPRAYQNINGKIVDVKAEYVLSPSGKAGEGLLTFKLGTVNSKYPLIIDPLIWATYYGGSLGDFGTCIAIDNTGSNISTGITFCIDFPVLSGFQMTSGGGTFDAFIVKFNAAGVRQWATYYGGNDGEDVSGITTDNGGNSIITGYTSSTDFPVVSGFQMVHGSGFYNAFVVKFNSAGIRLWATYYGGSGNDVSLGIATDNSGNYIITGYAGSADFPVLSGFQMVSGGGAQDAFAVQFNPSGVRQWATYYGGTGTEFGRDIATDNSGNCIITGYTDSPNFPVLSGFQMVYGGVRDAFVVKFNASGVRQWATYYGGSNWDDSKGIATDNNGNYIITGNTSSPDFPVLSGFQMVYAGGSGDDFVVKLNSSGTPQWATYHGGNKQETASKCATDKKNNIYILGEWEDDDNGTFPMNTCAMQTTFGGIEDFFISKYSSTGQRICTTFLGGPTEEDLDSGGDIAVDNNYIYVTSYNVGGGFPVTAGAFQQVDGGGAEAVIVKFCGLACGDVIPLSIDFTSDQNTACTGTPVGFISIITNTISCDTGFINTQYLWSFAGGTPAISTNSNPTVTWGTAGSYDVKLVYTTPCGIKDSIIKTNYINITTFTVTTTTTPTKCINNTGTAICVSTGGIPGYTYSWSNEQTGSIVSNLGAGIYTLTVTDSNGCIQTRTITITTTPNPEGIAEEDTSIFNGGSVTLYASGGVSYQWFPAAGLSCNTCAAPIAFPSVTTIYCVTVTDANGCTDDSCVTVTVEERCGDIFVPTAFSPNKDGQNEQECIFGTACLRSVFFAIYDRWGERVFTTTDPKACWDGIFKNKKMDGGIFVYYLNAILKDKQVITKRGNITLVK